MNHNLNRFRKLFFLTTIFFVPGCFHASAVTVTAPLVFTKSTKAPLAGTLEVKTDLPSRVTVSVDDGFSTWERAFFDYGTDHLIPLFGFKPNRTNAITVTLFDVSQNEFTDDASVTFLTSPLPANFPVINILVRKPELMEPGYNLFRTVVNPQLGYIMIVDNTGEVVWYSSITSGSEVRQLPNGHLLMVLPNNINEVDLLGNTVKSWTIPNNLVIDTHDAFFTDHGSILYLNDASRSVPNYPTSATDPNAPKTTANLQYDNLVEMSATNSSLLNKWPLIDLLDPYRISYLTFTQTSQGYDTEHGNAVIEDPRDGSIIVSLRNQNAVICFTRDGRLKWILGPHENWGPEFQPYLLTPVGQPFEWNYGQHAPRFTPQGTLLVYDDGNFRASPFDASIPDSANYSRAVEYKIDEQKMEVSQVWEYGQNVPEQLYTGSVGLADWLPQTGNILVNFGNVSYVNHQHPSPFSARASMARIKEVTHEPAPEVVFDMAIFDYNNQSPTYNGNWVYRCYRIPDLYPHQPVPVGDLNVEIENGIALLQFAADPLRDYAIESSPDLTHWSEVATPQPDENGSYSFEDAPLEPGENRFYRVITE
jgi:arylsulfate sulfotransferase